MVTLCSYCGKPLQKDDARFCNNCGMLIPSHPFSPQSLSQSSQQQSSQRQHPQSEVATPVDPGTSLAYTNPANVGGIARNPVPETGNAPLRPAPRIENRPAPQSEQSMSEPSAHTAKADPPEWMSRLGKNPSSQSGILEEQPPDGVPPVAQQSKLAPAPGQTPRPTPGTGTLPPAAKYIPGRGLLMGKRETGASPHESTSPPTPPLRPNTPQRELRVKVWEQDSQIQTPVEQEKPVAKTLPVTPQVAVSTWKDVEVLPISVPDSVSAQARVAVSALQSSPASQEIEDLPTSLLDVVHAEQAAPAVSSTPALSGVPEVEDLPTRPLQAYAQEKPQARMEPPLPEHEQQHTPDAIEDVATLHLPAQAVPAPLSQQKTEYVVVRDSTPAPGVPPTRGAGQMPSQPGFASPDRIQMPSQPGFASFDSAQALMQMPPSVSTNSNVSGIPVQNSPRLTADVPPTRRSRKWVPLVIALVVMVVLAAGVGGWIVIAQPFAVSAITTPLVSFQDQSLGVSVQYPRGWTVKIDRSKSVITFYDSSHTDQVTIQVASATTTDLMPYLQQQATAQSVTAAKAGSALTFGGSTWQQLQGNVSLSGASYSEVFLVSKHGNHLYTLSQLAPQISYADEEKVTFSPMRATWQFLS